MQKMDFDAWKCNKCHETIFTEEQATTVAKKLDGKRLAKEYHKQPLRIGRSWGMTFPKEVAETFNLNDKKTKMRLVPHIGEGKITIEIEE
jgi:hypothetical protein